MSKRLELLIEDRMEHNLDTLSGTCECTKSDVARAALKLGLKQISEQGGSTGLSTPMWIAALNGKVK